MFHLNLSPLINIPPFPKIHFLPFSEIAEERRVLLITSAPAWNAVKNRLHLPLTTHIEVTQANLPHWDNLLLGFKQKEADVIYAVGGGLAADAAKYLAFKLNLPLVCLPTALSVDAFLTAFSGHRQNGCVYYLATQPPNDLIIDFEVLAQAPLPIRAAGITDVLSIATGSWDWQLAHERGMNPPGMEFIPWVHATAQSILSGALDCSEGAGRANQAALKTLFDCLCLEVQLCNQIGHSRPEEGSEHYFAYCVENLVGHGLSHGELVGPGILLMARMQGQETAILEKALRACHIPLDHIPEAVIQRTLHELPGYVRKHHLPYGIAHELQDHTTQETLKKTNHE